MNSILLSINYAHRRSHKSTHYHDCHQILYITKGTASITVNGSTLTAASGDLILFSRLEQHAVTSRSDDYTRYVLNIAPQLPDNIPFPRELFALLSNRPAGFSNVISMSRQSPYPEQILERMIHEQAYPDTSHDQLLNLLLQELLIDISRSLPNRIPVFQQNYADLIYDIQHRLESDYQSSYSLSDLAEEFGISASYLSHLFKRSTGHSIMGYLQSCRIAAAKKYLAETTMGINQIVEICGFTDNSNFSRSFRQFTGYTPSQFRRKYHSIAHTSPD